MVAPCWAVPVEHRGVPYGRLQPHVAALAATLDQARRRRTMLPRPMGFTMDEPEPGVFNDEPYLSLKIFDMRSATLPEVSALWCDHSAEYFISASDARLALCPLARPSKSS